MTVLVYLQSQRSIPYQAHVRPLIVFHSSWYFCLPVLWPRTHHCDQDDPLLVDGDATMSLLVSSCRSRMVMDNCGNRCNVEMKRQRDQRRSYVTEDKELDTLFFFIISSFVLSLSSFYSLLLLVLITPMYSKATGSPLSSFGSSFQPRILSKQSIYQVTHTQSKYEVNVFITRCKDYQLWKTPLSDTSESAELCDTYFDLFLCLQSYIPYTWRMAIQTVVLFDDVCD